MTALLDILKADAEAASNLDCAIAIGLNAAADEETSRWRLAHLAAQMERAHGKAVIKELALRGNRHKCYIYECEQVFVFYGIGNILELTANRAVTYSHMRDAMRVFRKLHPGHENVDTARDESLHFLGHVADNLLTVEQAGLELKALVGDTGKAEAIKFTAVVDSNRDGILSLFTSDVDGVFGVDEVWEFSARRIDKE